MSTQKIHFRMTSLLIKIDKFEQFIVYGCALVARSSSLSIAFVIRETKLDFSRNWNHKVFNFEFKLRIKAYQLTEMTNIC